MSELGKECSVVFTSARPSAVPQQGSHDPDELSLSPQTPSTPCCPPTSGFHPQKPLGSPTLPKQSLRIVVDSVPSRFPPKLLISSPVRRKKKERRKEERVVPLKQKSKTCQKVPNRLLFMSCCAEVLHVAMPSYLYKENGK